MYEFLLILGSYLIGSLNFAIILSRVFRNSDIRQSDHAGASGVFRKFGPGLGIAVMILDIAKGLFVGWTCHWLFPDANTWVVAGAGLAVIAGHDWPIYFRFSGGGGLAPGYGFILMILPLDGAVLGAATALLALLFWKSPLAVLRLDRPIPTATIIAIPIFFAYLWIRYGFFWYGVMILMMGLAIMFRRIRTTWSGRWGKGKAHA
jgi:glycerol-3-phosphate acyltransferase PlsY